MGYIEDVTMVRVDIFKESGKWYETVAIKWLTYDNMLIHEAFYEALNNNEHTSRKLITSETKWIFVCLEPYHKHSHPITLGLEYH